MLYPLLVNLVGFSLFCVWAILGKARNLLLIRECRQAWVKDQFATSRTKHSSVLPAPSHPVWGEGQKKGNYIEEGSQ